MSHIFCSKILLFYFYRPKEELLSKKIMKNYYLTTEHWHAASLLPVSSSSDFYYVNLARRLYEHIRANPLGRNSDPYWVAHTAANIALYLEDVVSELGQWRTFVKKHKELYGKYLPFYEVNEDEYYLDEINKQDICFLLWSQIMAGKEEGMIVNPYNFYLLKLTEEVYKVLDKEFEKAPINNDKIKALQELLADGKHKVSTYTFLMGRATSSFIMLLDYEIASNQAINHLKPILREDMTESTLRWLVDTQRILHEKSCLLAMKSAEWLCAFLHETGNEECARVVSEMKILPLSYYLLKSYDDTTMVLQSIEGEEYSIDRNSFEPIMEQLMTVNKVCLAQLICLEGKWTAYGSSSWYTDENVFTSYKEASELDAKRKKEVYDKVMEHNGGYPVAYFKDLEAMNHWLVDELHLPPYMKEEDEKNIANLAFFVSPKSYIILNWGATTLKDSRNPLYQVSVASERQMRLLCSPHISSPEFFEFMLEHGMLTDAALASVEKGQDGKKLVQDNLDFIARFMRQACY